ncbi:hypothetical protein SUGI_0048810 [Cryptomeria japonica]|uniref:uncharacterized protein LOC131069121 isoform X3 n=1 Tax=Cryptomeria japonica TaxID=3369 RepID=UPI002408BB75|nr:uncharacterized protein LOC131069121 isoform X3 [Cryptomeria japonica]GLJ06806.1 hypothetical protein SUGI_0048810 [Cryptomeria japonica]
MASSCLQKMQRAALTVFIMFVMVGSLIFCSAPVVVCILDVVLPYALLSSFRYCSCGFKVDWTTYNFGFSLVDIPFISLLRSMSILCVYSVFDAPSLSFGPYLWTALLCGIVSTLGHIVVAYRIRCKVWRKMLLFHQLDPEVVACKTIFNGYTKAPQSTIAKANSGEKCFFHGNRGCPVML